MERMKDDESWKTADLIDFELLVQEDEQARWQEPDALRERDRRLFAEMGAVEGEERRGLFRRWLEKRRAERFEGEFTPGEEIASFFFWVQAGLFGAGLLLARASVWSFFRGAELSAARAEPINVLWYWVVCIGLPFLFTLYGFWLLIGPRMARWPQGPAFLRGTLLRALHSKTRRITARISERLPPEKRLSSQAMAGVFKQRFTARKDVLNLQALTAIQIFGVAFAAGVLVFSWIDVRFYSRIFGWQTTDPRTTAEGVHEAVKFLAAPWRKIAPEGEGFPTLQQVAQTRYVRLRDPAPFPPEAAASWANFLVGSALVYGFVPRLVLLLVGRWQLRRTVRAETFEDLRFDPLYERLTRPHGVWSAPEEAGATEGLPESAAATRSREARQRANCVLIIPSDLNEHERTEGMVRWLAEKRMLEAERTIILEGGTSAFREAEEQAQKEKIGTIVLAQESFMPPVREVLEFISRLAENREVLVGLIGKPGKDALGAPPGRQEVEVWRARVAALGKPGVDLFTFREPQS